MAVQQLAQRKIPPPFTPVLESKEDTSNFPGYVLADEVVDERAYTKDEIESLHNQFEKF